MNPKIKISAEGGKLNVENVSANPFDALFKVTMVTEKKTFMQKLKDLFSDSKCECIVYIDRKNSKDLSTFMHNEITAADKTYKESKKLTKDVKIDASSLPVTDTTTEAKPKKKRTYKPRKKKVITETSTSAE